MKLLPQAINAQHLPLPTMIQWVFSGLTAVVAATLLWSLTRPAFTLDKLGSDPTSFSVLRGGLDLIQAGAFGLGIVVLGFSAVFPILKLFGVAFVVWSRADTKKRSQIVRYLEFLGKWSMLDVFVVATLIGAAQLGVLSNVTAEPGIYWFMVSIMASILVTVGVAHWIDRRRTAHLEPTGSVSRLILAALSATALILYLISFNTPLLLVEKWYFWERDYSLFSTVPRLSAEGELILACVFFLFVILLPVCRLLALLLVRLSPDKRWLVLVSYHFDKWSMLDVYLCALLVFVVKVGDFANVDLRSGFWFFAAAAGISILDGVLYRRGIYFRWS